MEKNKIGNIITSKQKAKGYRYEKKTEELLNTIQGCVAKRNYMSGALKNEVPELDGDVKFSICDWYSCGTCMLDSPDDIGICDGLCSHATFGNASYKVEVKARDKGFPKWIRHALEQGDMCMLWDCSTSGKSVPYMLMPFDVFKGLIE